MLVAFQERLLALAGEHPVHRLARAAQPQGEQEPPGRLTVHPHPHLREVDLGVLARQVPLRHKRPLGDQILAFQGHLRSPPGDIVPHRGVRQLDHVVLVDQPLPHPLGGMALLPGRVQVPSQPLVDGRLDLVQLGRPPHRRLPWRRHRAVQRLADRAPMHPIALGQRPHRQALLVVAADLLEDLHA